MRPYVFDEFFASGRDESISPFLTRNSRKWAKNLPLKGALASALFLLLAFTTSFHVPAISMLFLAGTYFLSGTPALLGSIEDIKNFNLNIDVLMTLAALLSVVIGSEMEGGLLLVLFEFSGAMESAVAQKTKSALVSLRQLSPRTACVIGSNGDLFDCSVKDIEIGTSIMIKAGEIIPLDGIVIDGKSDVNMIHLTGESASVPLSKGCEAAAGARNLDGTLVLKVTRVSADSTLSRIIQLITQAQEAKPKLEQFLTRFGNYYAMTIIALFFLFAGALPLVFSMPYLGDEGSIYRALTFLIAASPCALIIATPTAYLSAISSCAKRGILLKGGAILDALAKTSIIAFDKTGTITTGSLTCVGIELIEGNVYTATDAIAIAAGLERHAVHPIAEAIMRAAQEQGISPAPVENFQAIPGSGLQGTIINHEKSVPVAIGHDLFINSKSTIPIRQPRREGQLRTLLLIGHTLFAFHFTDEIRPSIKELIENLKREYHIRITMLTGDHHSIANEVAQRVGIDEVYADMRPEEKLTKVTQLSEEGSLAMIGDGINDAPALARASVGISMGKVGSATAVDASDVVFLQDDLPLIEWLIKKSKHTMRIVKQNLTLALGVILFATTPALLGFIPLWIAVLLHEGGTVIVGINSLRLLRNKGIKNGNKSRI